MNEKRSSQVGIGGPFVSVVIPAHNEEQYIGCCIASLKRQTYPKNLFEIILVDNNSSDQTINIAQNLGIKVLEKPTGNVGSVRNEGVRHAQGEIIAFLDGDCIAPTRWIEEGVRLLGLSPHTAFGGAYLLRDKPFWCERFWLLEDKHLPKSLLGGSIFILKEVFNNVGMFREDLTSGEDTQLSDDLILRNYKVSINNSLSVVHLGNPTKLSTFFKRQIWHSENYLQNMPSSIRDLTFYGVLFFMTNIALSLVFLTLGQAGLGLIFLFFSFLAPLVFSAKRLRRSKQPIKNLRKLPMIYTMDLLYLLGRTFGVIKSLKKRLRTS